MNIVVEPVQQQKRTPARRTNTKRRRHKVIGFKAYTDTDADLLAWWDGIEPGGRSEALRELMRMALGYLVIPARPEDPIGPVREDTAWIRSALMDLPGYVERVIQHVAAAVPASSGPPSTAEPVNNDGPNLSDVDAARRARRMQKAKW